jgi:hypothetical protein
MVNADEKIETVPSRYVSGNLLAAALVLLSGLAFALINPLYGWLYLAFAAFSVWIIVRRMMCSSCYYCKSCTKGMAKLSILFLGANKIPGISRSSIVGTTVYLYVVLMLIPIAVLANSLLVQFNLLMAVVLVGLVAASAAVLVGRVVNRNRALWKR